MVMRHTAHTVRAARLAAGHRVSFHSWFGPLGRISRWWYLAVGIRWQRVQQWRAARRWQRSQFARLWVACGCPQQFVRQPRWWERAIESLFSLLESERERSAREWQAVRQQERSTRHLWPARYR
jgi:hypothetical protein